MRLLLLAPLLLSACSDADSATMSVAQSYDLESRINAMDAQLLALEAQRDERLTQQRQTIGLLTNRVARLEQGLTMTCAMRAPGQLEAQRAAEADQPVPEVPTWAGTFLTELVVRGALRDALAYDAEFYGASYSARDQAFAAVAEAGRYELHHDTYDIWRGRILDVARQHLSDPARLEATWQQHKPTVLAEIRQAERELEVRRTLQDKVLPAFDLEITPPIRAAYTEQSLAWEALDAFDYSDICWQAMLERHQAAVSSLNGLVQLPDVDILQWRLRREAEGGPALVNAWRGIFVELAEALEPTL